MKTIITLALTTLFTLNISAQQKGNLILSDEETYGYLNCHMSDRGQWTAYALSRDGQHYHDLLRGDSIFSAVEMAGIEGGTRDAYICRRHDNKGYLMVTTDMNNSMTKRLNKPNEWSNFGINLLTSTDLINWKSTTFDFRQWQPSVSRVWAPQIIWDEEYLWPDGRKGGYMIYYSMLDLDREQYDRMYYSYADDDFTTLTEPQLLFDWGYATIDADINWIEADQQFHMMIKKEGGTPGIFTTSCPTLTGIWPEPDASHYVDFEGKKKCEGASAFQLKGGRWQIGYIEYSSRPRHYRLCDADNTLSRFSNPRDIEGVTGPQHGSFLRITKEEYERLQAWSDAQEKEISALQNQLTRANRYSMFTPQEKVYLHFDNTGYFQSETMHFKAYVTRTDTERLSNLSHVLYVDLVTPNGDVVERRKLMLDNGVARGDFKLDELLLTGFYEVRAYTRYMLNWGVDACFSRVLPIFKEPKVAGDYSSMEIDKFSYRNRLSDQRSDQLQGDNLNATLQRQNTSRGISVHFYPEGGNLVEGLESRVAYTVIDDDTEVARGSFMFTPWSGQPIKVSYNKDTQLLMPGPNGKYILPQPLKHGVSLIMDVMDDDAIVAQLTATPDLRHEMIGYALMHNGVIQQSDSLRIENGKQLSFRRNQLSEGVNQLTLFNEQGHILAERLFFVCPKPSEEDQIKVTTTTQVLQPLKTVSFDIQARPYSSLSFAAIDAEKTTGGKQGNIRTNLLLSSDLRGYVAHPDYYFEADDAEHRQAADLLMLVQGWRRYDWQEMIGIKPLENRHPIENRLAIYGKIVPRRKSLKVEGMELNALMYDTAGHCLEGEFVTGADGRYVFDVPDIVGDWALNLRAKREGELQNFNILIDRNFVPKGRYISPEESMQLPVDKPNFAWGEDESATYDRTSIDHLHRYLLPEVEVKKRSAFWKGWTDESYAQRAAIVRYNCEAEADRLLDEGKSMIGFDEWLQSLGDGFFGDIILWHENINTEQEQTQQYSHRNDETITPGINSRGPSYHRRPIIWIINNQYWGVTSLPSNVRIEETTRTDNYSSESQLAMEFPLLLSDVKSMYISEDLEAVRKHISSPNLENANPVVLYCYTRGIKPKSKNKGERSTTFQGFDVATYFEMDYDNFKPLEDVRRTLHWASFVTDAEGKAHIEFKNNLNCSDMIISIEGISIDGHLQNN